MDGAPGAVGACGRNTKRQQAEEKKILHQASTSDHTPKKKPFQLQKGLIALEDTRDLLRNSPMKNTTNMVHQHTRSLGFSV